MTRYSTLAIEIQEMHAAMLADRDISSTLRSVLHGREDLDGVALEEAHEWVRDANGEQSPSVVQALFELIGYHDEVGICPITDLPLVLNEGIELDDGRIIHGSCGPYVCECGDCGDLHHVDSPSWYGYDREEVRHLCAACHEAAQERREEEEDCSSFDASDHPKVRPYGANCLAYLRGFCSSKREAVSDRTPYMGVELEVLAESWESINELHEASKKIAILKADGSLPDDGLELVSVPATLRWHRENWDDTFDVLEEEYSADSNCGMHVHVSRSAIPPFTLGKLLVFLNDPNNENNISKIAQRSLRNQYASVEYNPHITDGRRSRRGRYVLLNRTNEDTIEFRLFAGTVDKQTFLKNLEFVAASIAFCRDSAPSSLKFEDFRVWLLDHGAAYPSLCSHLSLPSLKSFRGQRKVRGAKGKGASRVAKESLACA